jgi:hypothetical protein
MRWRGEEASRGADVGCEYNALSWLTLACEFVRTRLGAGVVLDRATTGGLDTISHSGSRSSR